MADEAGRLISMIFMRAGWRGEGKGRRDSAQCVCALLREAWTGHVDPFCVSGC